MTFGSSNVPEFAGFSVLREPLLAFHPDREQDSAAHPLEGLLSFGPYSQKLISKVLDPIRLAAIVPYGTYRDIATLISELHARHEPIERRSYLRSFPGFSAVFRVGLAAPDDANIVELPKDMDDAIRSVTDPWNKLADAITRAVGVLARRRESFDVAIIYLPIRWGAGFENKELDFDLHDYIKAVTAQARIPCQIVRDDKALSYACRASVAWRLGIALYCKAAGVPWKLLDTDEETASIGLSYTLRSTDGTSRTEYVTCCSQAFDSEGAGLEFLTYSTDQFVMGGENPYLSRPAMRHVMSRSLSMYQRRHGGRLPKRVIVHKSTDFRREESEGCFDALDSVQELSLIQVQQNVPWFGVQIAAPLAGNSKGRPSAYPSTRGTYLPLSGREVLLWTQGNAPDAVGGKDYYKEGRGIPEPLLLRRFAGHGGWHDTSRHALGLTKMDWNSDALYTRLPVTLGYAHTLARVVRRVASLQQSKDFFQVRFFM